MTSTGKTPRTDAEAAAPPAVLLVGHGSSKQPGAIRTLERHAAVLAKRKAFADVRAAVLIGEPRPADVLQDLAAGSVVIVPMFMCAGRTLHEMLPRALALPPGEEVAPLPSPRHLRLCPPIGLQPGLATIIAARAAEAMADNGWPERQSRLVLVAHGTRSDPASRQATESQAGRIAASGRFAAVATAFLEEPPSLAELLPELPDPVVIAGFFAAEGQHAGADIAAALAPFAGRRIRYLGAIGADAGIADLIAELAGCAVAADKPAV